MALIKVRYKGIADVREITAKQLKDNNNVIVDNDMVWHRGNGFSVVVDANDRLEEVLREQGHFTISALTDAGGETVVSTASDPDNEGDVLVDGDTGATTEVAAKAAADEADAQAPQDSSVGNPTGRTGKGSSTRGSSGSST
jgi:hypothetical protein